MDDHKPFDPTAIDKEKIQDAMDEAARIDGSMSTIRLRVFKAGMMMAISELLALEFANVRVEEVVAMAGDMIGVRAVMGVLGFTAQSVHVEYPENWKEAVKERWLPAWAKKRWPVKYRKVALERNALYPKLPIPSGGITEPVIALVVRDYTDAK